MNFIVIISCLIIPVAKSEFFTSMANMEHLVKTEQYMLTTLKNYIKSEEDRITTIKNFMTRVENALQYVNDTDIGKYLGNPVNSYLMLKRFSVDWRNLESMLTTDYAEGGCVSFLKFYKI